MAIIEDLIDIDEKLCSDLWNMVNCQTIPRIVSPKLIFPDIGPNIRFSEQEARTLFCNIVNQSYYYYSIETPTTKQYQLTGASKSRASTDLTLWSLEKNALKRLANIEFKSHASEKSSIDKDILKLVNEPESGGWVHLLKNIDSKTIVGLFKKFKDAFSNNMYAKKNGVIYSNFDISIVFCFCVIERKIGFIKHFSYSKGSDLNKYADQFFDVDYIIRDKKVQVTKSNNWMIIQP